MVAGSSLTSLLDVEVSSVPVVCCFCGQAVRLESSWSDRVRYMVVVYTSGRQDTEENILLGMDFSTSDRSCSIGMVLPLWSDTKIHLDGDGCVYAFLPLVMGTGEKKHKDLLFLIIVIRIDDFLFPSAGVSA